MRASGIGGTTRDLPGHQESNMRKSVEKSTNNYPLAILISALSENGVALKSSPIAVSWGIDVDPIWKLQTAAPS